MAQPKAPPKLSLDYLVQVGKPPGVNRLVGVAKIQAEWGYMGSGELSWIADKSKVNFMIRVVGVGMMSES